MFRLGKVGKIRLAMITAFALIGCAAGLVLATPYLEAEASAQTIMAFRSDGKRGEGEAGAFLQGIADAPADQPADESASSTDAAGDQGARGQGAVDWEGLCALNPDAVGWVSVPGTRIDYAIVQARAEDPDYYLEHDIAHEATPYGCPYLDADAADTGGLSSRFPVIYGHHLINGQMFSDFARFSSAPYAEGHAAILIETPKEQLRLKVIGANVVNADEEGIRTSFYDDADFDAYIRFCLSQSEVVLEEPDETPYRQVFCFVTCSYGSDNERTLVYAVRA